MKVTESEFIKMKRDLKVILDYFFGNEYPELSEYKEWTYFNLWHKVYNNRRYWKDNKNVIFVDGKRLLPHVEDFEYYVCDTNDNTLLTALKKAVAEIYKER